MGKNRTYSSLFSSSLYTTPIPHLSHPFRRKKTTTTTTPPTNHHHHHTTTPSARMGDKEQTCDAKLVLLGNSGVGKTSVVLRYVQGVYSLDQPSTIGASFMTKRMFLDDWKVKLQIWDTAGQERFRSMAPMYYRGASAAILVYDITSVESFENV